MGLADAFGKDDRTEIRTDDLIELVRESEKCRLLLKAADAEIPYSDIRKIFNQGNDLEEYLETGLSPDQIREIDKMYSEVCKELSDVKKELEKTKEELEKYRNDGPACADQDASETVDEGVMELSNPPVEESSNKKPKKKNKTRKDPVDKGQILALKKAGWSIKEIMDDMNLDYSTVYNVIRQEKKKAAEESEE